MTPEEFKPEFTEGLRAANNTIDPEFCLTPQSAVDLQSLLINDRPCSITNLHPLTGLAVAPLVPWMVFNQDGTDVNINAGQLAAPFMRGKNPQAAYADTLGRIDQTIEDMT